MEFLLCRRWAISKVKMPDPGGVLGVLFSEIPASFFHYLPSIMGEGENKQFTLHQVHLEGCLLWKHPAVSLHFHLTCPPQNHFEKNSTGRVNGVHVLAKAGNEGEESGPSQF